MAGGKGDDVIAFSAENGWGNGDEGDDGINATDGASYIIGGVDVSTMTAGINGDVSIVGRAGESAATTGVGMMPMASHLRVNRSMSRDPWIMAMVLM